MQGKLMGPRNPYDRNMGETSWRTMRNQDAFFEVPVRIRHLHDWQRAREDWYKVETKLVWAAFDAPEKIPILLRNEVIRGHREIFENPKWIERAIYWTKEARYWRVLGISYPFYDRDTLRVYTWDDKGQAFGQPVINSAMRDAISDLERAKKRKDMGLEPNYIWDRWGPNGFIDGARSDYLPRFQYNPYSDPDGVEVEPDELNAITSHEQIRDRYKEFIWFEAEEGLIPAGDSSSTSSTSAVSVPFEDSFTTISNGYLELHDFPDEVRRFYFICNLGYGPGDEQQEMKNNKSSSSSENSEGEGDSRQEATLVEMEARREQEEKLVQNIDDIRALIYLSAQLEELQPRFEEWYNINNGKKSDAGDNNNDNDADAVTTQTKNKWEYFKEFLTPLRDACDAKVEACRLIHWSCRDTDQAREYFSEKCGFVDFMMTSDKILTAASMSQLKTIQQLASNHEWGLPLCLALTDKEKADAVGVESYSIWREFEDLCIDRRRRMFTQRHTAPASEEKTLDFLLQQFAKRPQRGGGEKGTLGSEFDRESEPIGRAVQRRVLASDVLDQTTSLSKDPSKPSHSARNLRTKRSVSAYDSLRSNQFSGQTF